MLIKKPWTRRRLLQGLGMGALLTPFVPVLDSYAETTGYPTRFLLFYQPHGVTNFDWWRPSGEGTSFSLADSDMLQPLADLQDRLLLFDRLRNPSVNPNSGEPHPRTHYSIFTGREAVIGSDGGRPRGISFDQLLADAIGNDTPIKSLQSGVRSSTTVSARGAEQELPGEQSPYQQYERVFGGFSPSEGPGPDVLALKARRERTLDFVSADLKRLQQRVAVQDRLKIEAHIESIKEVEKKLAALGDSLDECFVPDAPQQGIQFGGDSGDFPESLAAHQAIAVHALSCQITRVASIQWGGAGNYAYYHWLDEDYQPGHHFFHGRPDDRGSQNRSGTTKIMRWHYEQFADMLRQLAAIPEGDGTALDNTVVMWLTSCSMTSTPHSVDRLPMILAGGENLGLRTGQLYSEQRNVHDVYVTLGQLFGLDIDTFGDGQHNNGPIGALV